MKKKITKAIIPAAGFGTRFLPQTKAMPKEMLPLIDKPIIQYVVEEAVAAGITDIIIVTGAHKRSIEDHFDHQYELEARLERDGKAELAEQLRGIADMANFIYIRQKGSYGTGTPILNAAHLLDDEPFLVLWADEIFTGPKPRAVQLVEAYERLQAPVISVIPVAPERLQHYGVPRVTEELGDGIVKIDQLVEKPAEGHAPSQYASVGGYILTPDIIRILQDTKPHPVHNEILLADAINELARTKGIYGQVLDGMWHDTGNKQKYLECIVEMALESPELGPSFRDYLAGKLAEYTVGFGSYSMPSRNIFIPRLSYS
jgi:UTP--glucose-1-phosphate uridylyltransferase